MLNRFPLWKYLLILAVLAIAFVYSAPNLYPDDPAIQVTGASTAQEIGALNILWQQEKRDDSSHWPADE